ITASINARARPLPARSKKGLPRGSGLLSLRFEERSLDNGCGRSMPSPLDRHFNLDPRLGSRIRRGDGGDRDVPLQQRRPATARGPPDLTIARVQRHLLPPRFGRRLRRRAPVPRGTVPPPPARFRAAPPPCGAPLPPL